MPRFSAAFRAARLAGGNPITVASVAWPSGTKHYGVGPRRIGGLTLEPRLIGGAAVTSSAPIKPGSLSSPASSMKFADADGEISRLLEAGEDPAGIACTYRLAMEGVDPEDWFTFLSGLLAFPTSEDGGYSQTLNIRANDRPLKGDADKAQFLPAEFSKAHPTTWNVFMPKLYGPHSAEDLHGKGLEPAINWSMDAVEGYRYCPTMGHAKAVPRVYKNGVPLTVSTDYDVTYPIRGKLFTSIDLKDAGVTAGNVLGGAAPTIEDVITCDVDGFESVGDGTGELITNLVDQWRHWLANFAFGDWRSGSRWNNPEDYPINLESFARAAGFATSFLPGGSPRFGGEVEAQSIEDANQKWLTTALAFRPFWSETSQFALGIVDHIFHGYGSPGFPSDVDAVYVRGRSQEIGVSFVHDDDVSDLVARVNLQALFGLDADGKTRKSHQTISVEDVTQTGAGAESYAMEYSQAELS